MATYLRIPEANLAGALGVTIGKATGAIVTAGNKALDVIEVAIASAKEGSIEIKGQVRSIRESALLESAAKKKEAAAASIAVGGSSYASFLKKVGIETATTTTSVGKTAEMLQAEAAKIIEQANKLINDLVSKNNLSIRTTVSSIDRKLAAIEATLTTILSFVNTLKTLIKTLRIPVAALKAAIIVIKALPIPQRWLLVCFTILESDALEMMTELVTQVDEQIAGIESVLDTIDAGLTPLRDRIRRIRASINLLDVSTLLAEASASDLNTLDEAGLYDEETGESLLDKIDEASGGNSDRIPFGNIGDVDLSDPYYGNQVTITDPGNTIFKRDDSNGKTSGSYIEDYYLWSRKEPNLPSGIDPEDDGWSRFPVEPEGWDREENEDDLWKIQIPRTGDGKPFGSGTSDSLHKMSKEETEDLFRDRDLQDFLKGGDSIQNSYGNISGSRDREDLQGIGDAKLDPRGNKDGDDKDRLSVTPKVSNVSETGDYDESGNFRNTKGREAINTGKILILGPDNFEQKPGILKVRDWEDLQNKALDRLKDLPLSKKLQDALINLKQREVTEKVSTSTISDDAIAYRAANGELYYLRIKEDSKSPKVAVRRYVDVTDARGIHILDGEKTFSLDKETLIEGMKLQLDLLTR